MSFESVSRLPEQVADVVRLDAWRSRSAWEKAARHLNASGLAAAVPAELVRHLESRGLVVWAAERSAA